MTVEQLINQLQELVHPDDRARVSVKVKYGANILDDDGEVIDVQDEHLDCEELHYDKQHNVIDVIG